MAVSKKTTSKDLEKKAAQYPAWTLSAKQDSLSQAFTFPSAVAALAFAAKITVHSELLQHHPVIELSSGKVKIKLQTQDTKGLTSKDFELAKKIDGLKL